MDAKIDGRKNNPEKSCTAKEGEHIPPSFSMSLILPFKGIKNDHDVYRGEVCEKRSFEFLKKHGKRTINFKKNKMESLTNKQQVKYGKNLLHLCKNS